MRKIVNIKYKLESLLLTAFNLPYAAVLELAAVGDFNAELASELKE
jgi:hypothetical protein